MAYSVVGVTPAILKDVSDQLGTISTEMKTVTANMDRLIEDLKKSWSDSNGQKFASRFETELSPKFSAYYNAILEYSDFVRGASEKYERAAQQISSTIS